MKILWQVSFRPFGKSKINDDIQKKFVENIKKMKADITLSVTQFDDYGVKNFLNKSNIKFKYFNVPKKKLPSGSKYSNSMMLSNSIKYFISKDFDYFIFSNADVFISKNIVKILSKQIHADYMGFVYPNILIKNGRKHETFLPHYGIDFIAFKLSKKKSLMFHKLLKDYKQFDWGVIDNFYISIGDKLDLKFENLYKKIKLKKIENKFKDFKENRYWQIKSWKKNNFYFKKFLKKNNLSSLYAYGSYYYLLLKFFRLKDLNQDLFFIYLRFYLFLPISFIKKIFKRP